MPIVFDFEPSEGPVSAKVGLNYVTVKLGLKGNEPFNLRTTFLQYLGVSNPSRFGPYLSLAYIDQIEMRKGEGKNYMNRLSSRISIWLTTTVRYN
jgi:hypothetical protein